MSAQQVNMSRALKVKRSEQVSKQVRHDVWTLRYSSQVVEVAYFISYLFIHYFVFLFITNNNL